MLESCFPRRRLRKDAELPGRLGRRKERNERKSKDEQERRRQEGSRKASKKALTEF